MTDSPITDHKIALLKEVLRADFAKWKEHDVLLSLDRAIYGTSVEWIGADGRRKRVDPKYVGRTSTITIIDDPHPTVEWYEVSNPYEWESKFRYSWRDMGFGRPFGDMLTIIAKPNFEPRQPKTATSRISLGDV